MTIISHPQLLKKIGLNKPISILDLRSSIQKAKCERSLVEFIKCAWDIVEPGQPYVHNWHVNLICEHLEAISRGFIKDDDTVYNRLLINVPPGFTKSLLVAVFWPSWEWGPFNKPHMRYICASHSQDLSIRDGIRMRRLIQSDWYQSYWGDRVVMTGDQNQKTKFENTASGFRQSIAAGSITGVRGDRIIIDDPLSVDGASSDAIRESTKTWFLEAVPTRMNNMKKSAIVVIMQRLHEEDTSGIILNQDLGYDAIILPMRYESIRNYETQLGLKDPRTEEGELLFPERFPEDVVDRLERTMGPFAASGQLQQLPSPRGGGILKREWWQLWDRPVYPPLTFVCASLDTAYTEDSENDYSALTVWGVFTDDAPAELTGARLEGGNLYDYAMSGVARQYVEQYPKVIMTMAWARRLELHDLVTQVAATCKSMKVDRLLIEGKASGISVAQEIRRLYSREDWGVEIINPGKLDKVSRAYAIQHLFAEKLIYSPDKEWAESVMSQCEHFPKGKHDDLVDTVSQALTYLRKSGMLARPSEYQAEMIDSMKQNSNLKPLYDV